MRALLILLFAFHAFAGQLELQQLAEVPALSASSSPNHFTLYGGLGYFIADDGEVGNVLWQSDGSDAGTERVLLDGVPILIQSLAQYGNALYFRNHDGYLGYLETANGQVQLTDLRSDQPLMGDPDGVFFWKDFAQLCYFSPQAGLKTYPQLLAEEAGIIPKFSSPLRIGQVVYIMSIGFQGQLLLHSSDGTHAGTRVVAVLSNLSLTGLDLNHSEWLETAAGLFFAVSYDVSDGTLAQLWKTDGTASGTELLSENEADSLSQNTYSGLIPWNNGLAFFRNFNQGSELVAVDGDSLSSLGSIPGSPARLTQKGDQWFFFSSSKFYRLDNEGSLEQIAAMTYLPTDQEGPLTQAADGLFYFMADYSVRPWVSDGSAAGTYELFVEGEISFSSYELIEVQGSLLTAGTRPYGLGQELLIIDSLGQITQSDLNPQVHNPDFFARAAFRDGLLFGGAGLQSARSGHTLDLGAPSPNSIFVAGNLAFMWVYRDNEGELWVSDGSAEGTRRLLVVSGRYLLNGASSGDLFYFSMTTPEFNEELWRSDGTLEGTQALEGLGGSYFSDAQGGVFKYARDESGSQLKHISADETSFQVLTDLPDYVPYIDFITYHRAAGRGWFTFNYVKGDENGVPILGKDLYVSDGSVQGTLAIVTDALSISPLIDQGSTAGFYLKLQQGEGYVTSTGEQAFSGLPADLGLQGRVQLFPAGSQGKLFGTASYDKQQLWVSDGSRAGTKILAQFGTVGFFEPQAALRWDYSQTTLLVLKGYFGGYEAWTSNGTAAGTHNLFRYQDQDTSQNVNELVMVNGTLYFVQEDRLYQWSPEQGIRPVDGLEQLYEIKHLTAVGETLTFTALDQDNRLMLYALGETTTQPPLEFNVHPWFWISGVFFVSVEPIEGGVYDWSIENGTLLGPARKHFILVRPGAGCTLHLTVTLPDGTVREGQTSIGYDK